MEIANQTKSTKRKKNHTPEAQFRHALDTCSKNSDLPGALALYETAVSENIHLSPYHFNILLHICSASIETLDYAPKQSAIDAGFRIFDRMVAAGAAPTEATVTSMARIASQRPESGAESAFDLVRTMGERYGSVPKLRTYDPALFAFCRRCDADKAYSVEDHMISMGVVPEEPEIAALLEVSAKEGKEEKVYHYLHKLRSSVRCVTASTADILEQWFRSDLAAVVGNSNGDMGRVKDAIFMNGGGWHGLGWLGKGGWEVCRSSVSSIAHCAHCGQKLACVDIDQVETQNFAESVANLALDREVKSNFRNFQEWVENHTDYEAIIDGANVGFYQQNFAEGGFSLSQLDSVVRELYERSRSKWPLIILHNKRLHTLMENPSNRQLIETWKANGALYTTPNGSNDDWYWLYAAVKLKCLLVTNDEMRDHIFELLGRNIFLKWKERHQVRYTFIKGDLKLVMPPQYSSVIQESETGSWHVPLDEKCTDKGLRLWLCITRSASNLTQDGTDLAAYCTQTLANLQKPLMFPAENANGVHRLSSTLHPSNDKVLPVNGKRKDRSPSPSESPAD